MKRSKTANRWLYKHTRRQLPGVLLLSVLSGVSALTSLWLAWLSKDLLESAQALLQSDGVRSVWDALHQSALYEPALTVVGVIIAQIALHIATSRLRVYASGRMEMRLRESVFSTLLHADYAAVHEHHSGELINRLTSDVTVISQGVTGLFPTTVSIVARLVGGIVLLITLAPDLSLILIGVGVVTIIASRLYGVRLKRLHKRCQEAYGKTRSFMQEAFSNLLSVKAFSAEKAVEQELDLRQEEHYRWKLRRNLVQVLGSTAVFALLTVSYHVMLVWGVCGLAVGTVTVGTLAALIQVFEQLQGPFRNASSLLSQYYGIMASAERLQQVDDTASEKAGLTDADSAMKNVRGLVLSRVVFSYDADTPVLRGVDLTVERGQCVALIGESGAGKSTLMKLILAIHPCTEGSITVEGDSSLAVGAATRRLMAYVPQGNTLISGTLRHNIAFFRDVTDEAIMEVLQLACLEEFISSLPNGLDTIIGEHGFGVSEGQAQRIGIARALLCDAPILLLDECTSALDPQTEERLLAHLHQLQDRAVLLISHKNTTVVGCDCVYRIEDGVLKSV